MMKKNPTISPGALKVVLVCHSDVLGGAGMVTTRLLQALRQEGVDARMIVYTKVSDNPMIQAVSTRTRRGVLFMLERLRIYIANGFHRENLFKVSIANTGIQLHRHPWVREADVIALNWINQGLLSLSGIEKLAQLGKPIVWTMHDMWCLTGICHHAYECNGFRDKCGSCQFLTGRKANDLSRKVLEQKKRIFNKYPIKFVAVSHWLAGKAKQSALLHDKDVEVIHNPFPIDFFTPEVNKVVNYDPDDSRDIIIMCAARLDDPIKGLPYAIDALNYIFDNHPEIARTTKVIFIGEFRDKSSLDNLRMPYDMLGRINDSNLLRQLYASAKIVLSTSLYETLPGTLIEGQASGCLPVSFGRGGQDDIIEHMRTGYIAEYRDSKSIAQGIVWALKNSPDRNMLHETVRQKFASNLIAKKYIDLFNSLIKAK